MEIYHPKVFNNGVNVLAGGLGAQTFINIDNDDNDSAFDIDDNIVEGGDNELAKIKFSINILGADFPTFAGESNSNKSPIVALKLDRINVALRPILGQNTVKMWNFEQKESLFDNVLSLKNGDFKTEIIQNVKWKTAEVWVEGITAHQQQQGAVFEAGIINTKDDDGKESGADISNSAGCSSAKVALTVMEVEYIKWIGMGNGGIAAPYKSNDLECDATNCKVYPDGRYEGSSISTSKDKVKVEIKIKPAPTNAFTLFVKSFDMDDPSQNPGTVKSIIDRPPSGLFPDKLILDPNDDGIAGTYEGGQTLTYTIENDNRAKTNKVGFVNANTVKFENISGKNSVISPVDDIFSIDFEANKAIATDIEFIVSQFAGDNYQLYAYCDRKYLTYLYNSDFLDKDKIVNLCKTNERLDCIGNESKVLTVWRLLHVEVDGMKNFTGNENQIQTYFTDFEANSNGDIFELKGMPNNILRDESLDLDIINPSPSQGRFENGAIVFDNNPPILNTIMANGSNRIILKNKLPLQQLQYFLINGNNNVSGKLKSVNRIAIGSTNIFQWNFDAPVSNLSNFIGGNIRVAENNLNYAISITNIDPNGNFVTTSLCKIPLTIRDDDQLNILPYGRTQIEAQSGILKSSMKDCFVLPIFDNGGSGIESNNFPFKINIWTQSNKPQFNSGTTNLSVNGQIWKEIKDSIQSESVESDNFWSLHLFGAFQGNQNNDRDPTFESTAYGITDTYSIIQSSENVSDGGQTSVLCKEAFSDPDKNNRGESWTIAHEVGHQFGLTHGYEKIAEIEEAKDIAKFMGLMAPPSISFRSQSNPNSTYIIGHGNTYIPRFINLIRSKIKSPGK